MNFKLIDTVAHILLYSGFLVGFVAVFRSRAQPNDQFMAILVLSAFYIVWGIVYHSLRRDISVKLLLEYLVIASIVATVGYWVFGS